MGIHLRYLVAYGITLLAVDRFHGCSSENPFERSLYMNSMVDYVNNHPASLWKASLDPTVVSPDRANVSRYRRSIANVDWRDSGLLRAVGYQGQCGSCWAFASSHTFDDYRSIKQSRRQTETSPHHLVSCCRYSSCNGCGGATDPSVAFRFMKNEGIVSDSCKPYSYVDLLRDKSCSRYCNDGTSTSRSEFRLDYYSHVPSTVGSMQKALKTGPLVVSMKIYQDFYHYKTGIYQHYTGLSTNWHLVEMVGYGRERDIDYWICKNSWGPLWGDKGYFKIRAGVNECGIESEGLILSPFGGSRGRPFRKLTNVYLGVSTAASVGSKDVIEAAQFASYEINPFCPEMETGTESGNLTLVRVNRASRKSVAGEELVIMATYQDPGCPSTTTYEMTIFRDLQGKYHLVRSRYVPEENVPKQNVLSKAYDDLERL